MTKLVAAFLNFANAPNKDYFYQIEDGMAGDLVRKKCKQDFGGETSRKGTTWKT
jgi:hypothetical protein